jgi:hypothetical protein
MRLGNCYGATEALYFLLGGKDSEWEVRKISGTPSHWFLKNKNSDTILDITVKQFDGKLPDYSKSRRAAFYPNMSKRARFLSDIILWRDSVEIAMKGV